jgi:elongation factor P--(R)-beta-lysine ligase
MTDNWKPAASLETLKIRARVLQSIRAFFAERDVLEVETPILSKSAITDPQLESFVTQFNQCDYYLHTSPEFYMKRLLAAGSGDIYQIARVFRVDEQGRNHNPEFSMLEWYRLGLDHHALMDEMESLIKNIFSDSREKISFERISYQQAFQNKLAIDPLESDAQQLEKCARDNNVSIPYGMDVDDKDMWLDWLMVMSIGPSFSKNGFTFLYDYPASQAALAKLSKSDSRIAHRFELFAGELELANGFYELTDSEEQSTRFINENRSREQRGQKKMPIDQPLLDALKAGMPECSGVAIGLDRLLMVLTQAKHIRDVIAFETGE